MGVVEPTEFHRPGMQLLEERGHATHGWGLRNERVGVVRQAAAACDQAARFRSIQGIAIGIPADSSGSASGNA